MTLRISCNAFDGMCSEFHDWRWAVATTAGFRLFDDVDGLTRIDLDWDAITDDNLSGVWTTPPVDPLVVLLAHSDIGGTIEPSDALRLADRLTELLIPSKWLAVTEKFVAACRLAGHRNEPLEFVWDPAATIRRIMEDILREKLSAAGPGWIEVPIPE
jgi:hypothetical protein